MLTSEQVTSCWEKMGRGIDKYATFARAIEAEVRKEQAGQIAELTRQLEAARKLAESCRDAFAEELSAWDIDPPIYHVKQGHADCVKFLAAIKAKDQP